MKEIDADSNFKFLFSYHIEASVNQLLLKMESMVAFSIKNDF